METKFARITEIARQRTVWISKVNAVMKSRVREKRKHGSGRGYAREGITYSTRAS